MPRKFDFGGYATKNDIRCSDGRTIRQGAFEDCDGKTVPLVWQHMHDDPSNVLGHAVLENRNDGVYAYCSLNSTDKGMTAKSLIEHGDVNSLSIYANGLKQRGQDVIHGVIREVSLVLSGANPGAVIENVSLAHADGSVDTLEEEVVISMMDPLAFAHADAPKEPEEVKEPDDDQNGEETIEDVFNTLTEKQKQAVYAIVGTAVAQAESSNEEVAQSALYQDQEDDMKYNAFEMDGADAHMLTHSDMEAIFADAKRGGSLKDAVLEHGITDIEVLFPEVQMVGGGAPAMVSRRMEWVGAVMGGVHKSPFSRIKSTAANITAEEARARGYIKGHQKVEEQISALKRTTTPQTVYKLQKLDRDDIIDITDFDVVSWMKSEMRMMLDEEIARAILVGDGRSSVSDDKISEDHIRPVWTDDEVYSVHTVLASATTVTNVIDEIIKAKKDYRGSGQPTMYIGTDLLTEMRLLKDSDGYRRYKTDQELADDLRVSKIVEVELFDGLTRNVNGVTRSLGCIIVNLADYNLGANKGGEVSLFDDFDLNYNKYEYLIETRVSGALYQPKSALVIEFAASGLDNVYKLVTGVTGSTGSTGLSGNPSVNGWFEKDGILYLKTKDTQVKANKNYYELA